MQTGNVSFHPNIRWSEFSERKWIKRGMIGIWLSWAMPTVQLPMSLCGDATGDCGSSNRTDELGALQGQISIFREVGLAGLGLSRRRNSPLQASRCSNISNGRCDEEAVDKVAGSKPSAHGLKRLEIGDKVGAVFRGELPKALIFNDVEG